jgi:lathosterol oxidase
MGMRELFEPSFGAYVSYCVGFCIRYFLVAGAIHWLCHLGFKQRLLVHRIQQTLPPRAEILHAVRWSLVNMFCMGAFAVLLGRLVHDGRTSMYFAIADRGWLYFGSSILIGILGYDTWIYWEHRLLHTPWLFRHAHAVHHRVTNPTTLTLYAFHPIETLMGNTYYLLFVVFVPVHPLALSAVVFFFLSYGLLGHSGYEFFPRGFTRHPLFQWISTSTHHNMHHRHVRWNYGNWFNYWDRLMGTNHPAYHETFDAIKARLDATPAHRAPAAGRWAPGCETSTRQAA